MVLLHYTVLLIVSLCYIPVLRAARQLPSSPTANDASTTALMAANMSPIESSKKAASSATMKDVDLDYPNDVLERRRLAHHREVVEGAGITLTHLLLQVVHYTPGTLHVAAQFFDYEDLWIYVVAVLFTQSGALMHAIVIAWSEWRDNRK
jgi:hypothetical protein